jgi:putative photosynthetic complex assembly protein
MSSHTHHEHIPRGALIGAGMLVASTLLLAGYGRLSGYGTTRMPDMTAVATRELRFLDQPDGSVAVRARDGSDIARLAPGTNGFARGVLRGLARARRRESIGSEAPFRLTRWSDGRLSLADPATGTEIQLDAFGPTNAAAFARLMTVAGRETLATTAQASTCTGGTGTGCGNLQQERP